MLKVNSDKKIKVSRIGILFLVITVILFGIVGVIYYNEANIVWTKVVSRLVITMMICQIYCLWKVKKNLFCFEIWFTMFSYLFMFGQIILVGIFRIDQINALGHMRNVLDTRYSPEIMLKSALFILSCIQVIVTFFVIKNNKRDKVRKIIIKKRYPEVFSAAVVLLMIGFPCHLIYSLRMIIRAQIYKSYDAIIDTSGLIDDFSNFFVYGLICLIFSGYITKKKLSIIIVLSMCYFVVIMGLTGDRRYQIVSIIVLLLAFFKSKKITFSWKWLLIGVVGYFMLLLFYILREIRTENLVSGIQLINLIIKMLGSNNILVQTLYEFGGSFYTVCLAFKYIPEFIPFKYGLTILSGIISIIPLGFIYQDMQIFTVGRLASELMDIGKTTVGASVFADLYGNFGIVGGLVFAAFFGLFLMKLFYLKQKKWTKGYFEARYYILFYVLIHLVRASFTEVIRTGVWGLMALYISSLILTRRRNL